MSSRDGRCVFRVIYESQLNFVVRIGVPNRWGAGYPCTRGFCVGLGRLLLQQPKPSTSRCKSVPDRFYAKRPFSFFEHLRMGNALIFTEQSCRSGHHLELGYTHSPASERISEKPAHVARKRTRSSGYFCGLSHYPFASAEPPLTRTSISVSARSSITKQRNPTRRRLRWRRIRSAAGEMGTGRGDGGSGAVVFIVVTPTPQALSRGACERAAASERGTNNSANALQTGGVHKRRG
jgi:hypothetical protein